MMKSYINSSIAFVLLMLSSCYSAGTLGGGRKYVFDCTRQELQECLNAVGNEHKAKIPLKWISYNNWDEKGYGFLNGVVFYFDETDGFGERMYYVTLVKNDLSDTLSTRPGILAGRSIFKETDRGAAWESFGDVNKNEVDHSEARIEKIVNSFSKSCGCKRINN